jgi:hypothetical protein
MVWENIIVPYPAGSFFHRKVITTHFPKYNFSGDRSLETVRDCCLRVNIEEEVE